MVYTLLGEGLTLTALEPLFEATENVATEIGSCAAKLQRHCRALKRAAVEGQPAKIKKAAEQIRKNIDELNDLGSKTERTYSLSEDETRNYLRDGYRDELTATARSVGIKLHELDDRLAAFPVVVQILPAQAAVRIGSRTISSLRPSVVASQIAKERSRPQVRPERFIEILYKCYKLVCSDRTISAQLIRVYEALTLLPQTRESYSKADFGRDIHLLATSNVRQTANEVAVSFPSATAAVGGNNTFVVVPDSGMPVYYTAIRFDGPT